MYYDATLPWEEPLPCRVAAATDRIASTPTIASLAARHRFDAQVCHLRFLQYYDDRVIPSRRNDKNEDADLAIKRMKTPFRRVRLGSTSTRSSSSRPTTSTESIAKRTNTEQSDTTPRPGNNFTKRMYLIHLGYKSISDEDEMDKIIKRLTRPTTASLGARNLAGKKYDYYTPKETKTYKLFPGIETRFMGKKQMSQEEYDSILGRLTKQTKASHWKMRSVPDPNSHPPRRKPGDFTMKEL